MKKIADCTAFVTKNLSMRHISFALFTRLVCLLHNTLKFNVNPKGVVFGFLAVSH